MQFANRQQAGQRLAIALERYRRNPSAIVLGLPRGGVPVAYEIAKHLQIPLDVLIVRKLGVPGHEELAMGAIAGEGILFINQTLIKDLGITESVTKQIADRELHELRRREKVYRGDRPFPSLKNKTVILVDDGIATGASMRSAIRALKTLGPKEIIVAIPVAPANTCRELEKEVDRVICLYQPSPFHAVGQWYEDFTQTTDEEVSTLLEQQLFTHSGKQNEPLY